MTKCCSDFVQENKVTNLYDLFLFVMQFRVGDRVWLGDRNDESIQVATGTVIGLGGQGVFHTRPIPEEYVRVNLEDVYKNTPLLFPVEDADQLNLEDARGSSVLWYTELTSIRE